VSRKFNGGVCIPAGAGAGLIAVSDAQGNVSWQAAPANAELGYAEITSSPPNVGTVAADIPGLAVTVTVGARPIVIKFGCRGIQNGTANGGALLYMVEGAATILQYYDQLNNPAGIRFGAYFERRLNPAAGTRTYKMSWVTGAGAASMFVGPDYPAWIQVVQV